jgi:hypothetical protein
MSEWPQHPTVYEVNTWAWLADLSRQAEGRLTLADVPQAELERMASYGFEGVWLMGVWQRNPDARRVALTYPGWQQAYRQALPDYTVDDVVGSPYAIQAYSVDPSWPVSSRTTMSSVLRKPLGSNVAQRPLC